MSVPYSNNCPGTYLSKRFVKDFKSFSMCICLCLCVYVDVYVHPSAFAYDCGNILKLMRLYLWIIYFRPAEFSKFFKKAAFFFFTVCLTCRKGNPWEINVKF